MCKVKSTKTQDQKLLFITKLPGTKSEARIEIITIDLLKPVSITLFLNLERIKITPLDVRKLCIVICIFIFYACLIFYAYLK